MLKALTLTNWKSFGEERNRVEIAPLTLLVGPNASGKSNVLDALRFLQGAAFDYPLGEVLRGRWEGQREIWPPIRGQVVEAARGNGTRFGLASEWEQVGAREASGHLTHTLFVDTGHDACVEREKLETSIGGYQFDTHAPALRTAVGPKPGGTIRAAIRSTGRGNSVTRDLATARSLLGQVVGGTRVAESTILSIKELRNSLRSIVFLDIQPTRMREYKPELARVLGASGENISPVLRALQPDGLDDIVRWIGELCAPTIQGIDFEVTQLKEVMFFLLESPNARISARSVSDGTLRFLGLVATLLTADAGSLIVLEEPDVGLHPARIHLLARLLEQVTSGRGVQVLATTHSPVLLAHLQRESLADVVALDRALDGTSTCTRLGDIEHFATLRDSRHLDHLISTGWIERAL